MLLIYSKSLVHEVNTQHVDVVHEFLMHVFFALEQAVDVKTAVENAVCNVDVETHFC